MLVRAICIALALVAVLASGSCADLPTGDLNRCGNGIHEPEAGEECDEDAGQFGPNAACGETCRLVCGDGAECPDGYACGEDEVCRVPSGEWALRSSFADEGIAAGAVRLTALQFAPDRPHELFRVAGRNDVTVGTSRECSLHSLTSLDAPDVDGVDCLAKQWVGDLDGDGLDDLLTSTEFPRDKPDGTTRFEVRVGPEMPGQLISQATMALWDPLPRLYPINDVNVARLGRQVGALDANLRLKDGFLLPEDLTSEEGVAALSVGALGLEGLSTLALAASSPGRVLLYDFRGPFAEASQEEVLLPVGVRVVGRPTSVDVNGDGRRDLLVLGDDSRMYAAYTTLGGALHSSPESPVNGGGDSRFSALAVALDELKPIFNADVLLAAGDVNGDGCTDLAFRSVLFEGAGCAGENPFSGDSSRFASGDFEDVQLADLDLNGRPDVVALNRTGALSAPGGLFVARYAVDGNRGVQSIEVAPDGPFLVQDVTDDLVPDIVYTRRSPEGGGSLMFARGQPGSIVADPVVFGEFPVVDQLVKQGGPFATQTGEFIAVVRTEAGIPAGALFGPGIPPRPFNAWQVLTQPATESVPTFNPRALALGEFDGQPEHPELAGLVGFGDGVAPGSAALLNPSRLAHIRLGEDQLVDVFGAAFSDARLELLLRDYYAVATRVGLDSSRDALVIAVPTDLESPAGGSDIYAAVLDDDRLWSFGLVMHVDALIATRPALFATGPQRIPLAGGIPEPEVDPLGHDRPGARTLEVDLEHDGIDEVVLVPDDGTSPWLVLGTDGAGAIVPRLLIASPTTAVHDVIVDPTQRDRVIWSGTDGTFRGLINLDAERTPGLYDLDEVTLTEIETLSPDGGDAVAAGQFDGDGLLDFAIGDSMSVRVYIAVATRP